MTLAQDRAAIRKLATELARLSRKIDDRTPQLIHSSIQDGAVNIRDTDGGLTGALGLQVDGRFGAVSLGGPPPPAPAAATGGAAPSGGALMIQWAGGWADNVTDTDVNGVGGPTVAPTTFSHIEVHASPDNTFSGLLFSTLRGTINSARGGWLYIPADPLVPLYVRLVARDINGKATVGPISGPFTAVKTPPSYIDVDFETLGSGTTVFYGPDEPTTDKPDLWLKEVDAGPPAEYETYRYDVVLDDWVLLQDQGISSSLAAAVAAQNAAAAKAQIFNQPTEPAWSGPAGSAIWFDSDNGNAARNWDGDSFEPLLLGNGAIQPGSLIASDVIATGSITAGLLEAIMVLANIIIAGDPAGMHTRIDNTGLSYQSLTPDGIPYEVSRFGVDAGGTDPSGNTIWNIDENGLATVQGLTVNSDPIIEGVQFTDIISPFMKFVAGASRGSQVDPVDLAGPGEMGYIEFTVELQPLHLYLLMSSNIWVRPKTGCSRIDANLRYTVSTNPNVDPPPVSLTSQLWARDVAAENGTANTLGHSAIIQRILRYGTYAHIRFLLSISAVGGGAQLEMGSANSFDSALGVTIEPEAVQFMFFDAGPIAWTNRAVTNDGGGGTTPAAKKQYTYDYFSHWSRRFSGAGGVLSDNQDGYQGQTPYYPGNGDQATQFGNFTRSGGVSLQTDLAGATVEKLWVYLYANHWHYNNGGTARIRYHNNTNPTGLSNYAGDIQVPGWARGEGRWVDITAWASLFQGTGAKGIQVGPAGTTDPIFYGVFDGPAKSATAPRIRCTFTK